MGPESAHSLTTYDAEESPVRIVDPALPAMSEESTPGTPRMQLFFVLGAVQTLPVWILADSGSVRNLIDEGVFNRLPYRPPLRDPGEVRVIGGNGEALDLKGFAVLPVSLGSELLWHEFGVVPDLPLEVLVGADILAAHQCSLLYLKNNRKRLLFGHPNCPNCERYRRDPEVGDSVQLRFVDRNPKRRRNRLKIGANFVATLPEVEPDEDGEEPIEKLGGWVSTLTAEPQQVGTSAVTNTATAADTVPKEASTWTTEEQCGKLQKVLADLRVATLPIQDVVQKRLIAVVKSNLDAFAASNTDYGRTSVVMHTIKTGEAQPFRHKLRPIPFARRQFLEQEVEKLLAIGAISVADPGACPYASRTVIAPKKDGSLRMCVDYRDVNAQSEKDAFPLPRIDQVWPLLSKAKYFASLDLLMGYHQVVMDPKDRAKTAFLTHRGLFVYNVMPFGLCNAPATFQRLMEKILGSLIGNGVLVYLDDILIYAETPEQLLDILSEVLKRLAAAGLKCKPSKCSLFTKQVNYLGHIVSKEGINPEPAKLEKIKQWPKPEKGKGLASFLGLCNYYRELIPSFAHISDPLYKASRQEFIEWTPALTASFEQLKYQLLEPRIVRMPDPQRDFILETDGSRVALGAVLKQKFDDTNLEHPVGFFSRSLTGSERNYVAYELEMYAVVRAVEHFRVFLLGKEFLLRTDHAALRNLLKRDLPPTTRVERWILRLSEYTFRIEHQKGQDNIIADVLSRLPFASGQESGIAIAKSDQTSATSTSANSKSDSVSLLVPDLDDSSSECDSEANLDTDDEAEVEQCNSLSTSAPLIDLPISREGLEPEDFTIPTREEFAKEQDADEELKQLRGWIEAKQYPSADELAALSGRMKAFVQLFEEISVRDGVLVITRHDDPERELTIVPSAKVEHIIRFYHEGPGGAHQAAKATSAKVIRCFWWPDLKRDVRLYIACCPVCERFLKVKRTPRAGLRSMDVGGRGDCLAMDIVGGKDSFPLTPRGHRYILTMIDCFTRYAVAVPLVDHVCRGCHCCSHWQLHYGVRYPSSHSHRSRT